MARLSGKWTLQAIGNDAGWQQRILISGSIAHDGPHVMTLWTAITHVEGQDIEITAQAFNPTAGIWVDSLMQDVMQWDNARGLQVRLNVDDNPPNGDLDFNDLVVLCTAEDTALSSPLAGTRPDLTIPERFVKHDHQRHPGRHAGRSPGRHPGHYRKAPW
jgi:hypothetical protein